MPVPRPPIWEKAVGERSMIRSGPAYGPRSRMTTLTERPFAVLVTLTTVPNGRVVLALVRPPMPYQVARPEADPLWHEHDGTWLPTSLTSSRAGRTTWVVARTVLKSLPSWKVLRNTFCVSPLAPVCPVDSTPSSSLSDCLVVVLNGTSMLWRSVVWVIRTIRTTATPGRVAIRGGVTLSSVLILRPICWSRPPTVGAVEEAVADVPSWRTI